MNRKQRRQFKKEKGYNPPTNEYVLKKCEKCSSIVRLPKKQANKEEIFICNNCIKTLLTTEEDFIFLEEC